LEELLIYLAKSLVEDPSAVSVKETQGAGNTVVFQLSVAPDDMGRVIGKQGRIARAIRAVMSAAASRENKKVIVEIV
jgi:predicted RNA-binding protein YlqC (UPF0109 family)